MTKFYKKKIRQALWLDRKGLRRKYEDGTKWISYNIPEAEQNI
jgi:hypothetical protein